MNKEKVMDLKKFIKEENTSVHRLQSLRMPRDLNLGGPKIVKKQFIPNLNVVRNKDKVKDATKKTEQKRNVKNNDKHSRQNNAGQRYIQSSGIFSEGSSSDGKRGFRNGIRHSNTKENDVATAMAVPTINKHSWEYDMKNEENVFNEILATEEEEEDQKLPFQMLSWSEKDFKPIPCPTLSPKLDHNPEFPKIKTEPEDELLCKAQMSKIKLENPDGPVDKYQTENLYSDENPILTLWRLPDSFGGRTLSDDPNDNKLLDYTLNEMPEGQIGKLVSRRSGAVEIHIGSMKYYLEPADLRACREEVVALDVKENNESSAAVLGQIENRYFLNPDWNSLLNGNKL